MMGSRFVGGALIGAAVGIMLTSEMNGSTRRKMRKTSRHMKNTLNGAFDGIMKWAK